MAKILMTGISSFTGYHFAKELVSRGHELVGTITKNNCTEYFGGKKIRLQNLEGEIRFVESTIFGDEKFIELISKNRFDWICHHGACVDDYRSPNFPMQYAVERNTLNAKKVLNLAYERGSKFILTSSYAEKGEGGLNSNSSMSLYGESKSITSNFFINEAKKLDLPLIRFVIPNPFGPFEEERFGYHVARAWFRNECFEIKTPEYVRDNIHISYLSKIYAFIVEGLIKPESQRVAPSQYVETQGEFALRMAKEFRARLSKGCEVKFKIQTDWDEPKVRHNDQPISKFLNLADESNQWDKYVSYYEKLWFN